VIPVFYAEDTLEELIHQLNEVLPKLCNNFEIILVNDGSKDKSWQIIQTLQSEFSWIRGINLMRNYGQHNAILCGVRAAEKEIIVTMDDDLQNPPSEINKLLLELEKGYDVVYGTPVREKHNIWRHLASQITKLALQSTMGVDIARKVSAFRAFRTCLRQAFEDYQAPFVTIDVLLTWGTDNFSAVEVHHSPRYKGRSNYTFHKLIVHAINMITGFTVLPLQIASLMGFLFAIFGFVVLLYVIGRYFIQGGSVPGFPFLASIVAIFSGVQLFAIGIIGEYMARMHFRVMNKPTYVVRHQISIDAQKDENN
jgi:undecaprenyl-phosphate 4-deoxy-4-formamido-L-arabinose transferase